MHEETVMLDGIMVLWFLLTGLSLVFVILDLLTNTPVSWVQKFAWILVIAYTGPIGLFMFLLTCRSPGRGLHDQFTKASWKQGVNSEMHCLAGDATGIIVSAIILSFMALSPGVDLIIEYVAAWVTGLFIFQALMMIGMFNNNYFKAVRKTIFVETVSMNMVMVGMIPVMVVLLHEFPSSDDPWNPLFWFRMSMGTVVGGLIGFPINWWMVHKGIKHGCMSTPEKAMATSAGHDMPMGDGEAHGEHAGHDMPMDHDMSMDHGSSCHGMDMPSLPLWQQLAWSTATFALLAVAIWITTMFAPIKF